MFSDRYINKINKRQISISLKESDYDILFKLKKVLKSSYPIKFYKDDRPYHGSNRCVLNFTSEQIANNLFKLGYVQGDNHKIKFPTYIPIKLLHHFVRGYFDGDGSVFIAKKSIGIGIIGEDSFIENLFNIVKKK